MNNENNNDIYQEDNGFNNQGIVDSPDTTQPVEQQTQLPRAGKGGSNFGNIAQGLPGQLKNKENNPGLGLPKHKNNNNNPAKGQQKPENKNKKDGLGDKNKKNDQNKNKGQNNKNQKRNPLPGGGTNKKDDRRDKKPDQNKNNNNNNKKNPLGSLNPFTRRREMQKSRFGMGRDKESGSSAGGPNLNTAKKSLLKKAWMVAPIQVKIIVITIVPVLLLLALIMAAIFGGTTAATVASICSTDGDSGSTYNGEDYTGSSDVKQFMCKMQNPLVNPSLYKNSDNFGDNRGDHIHAGVDLASYGHKNIPIYAAQSGTVAEAGSHSSMGNYVKIKHGNSGIQTTYMHMVTGSVQVKKGDKVGKGQLIGKMGTTGRSTGVHLHFEIRLNGKAQDPGPYFKKDFKASCGSDWDGEPAGDSANAQNDTTDVEISSDSTSSSGECCDTSSSSGTTESSGEYCPDGIVVKAGSNNTGHNKDPKNYPVGTFSLDEYVEMVVNGENGGANKEALKAQAVAARTYTLNRTNNCSKPIRNSTEDQVARSGASEELKKAVSEVNGSVMLYNGKYFSSEYSSFKGSCSGSTCTGTVVKQPSSEKTTFTMPKKYLTTAAGHGRGLSQNGSNYMAAEGKTYDEILKFFYAEGIEITASTGGTCTVGGNGYDGKIQPYYQNDYKDAYCTGSSTTIASSGCGPTSMAIVVSSLLGEKHDPVELAKFSCDNGYRIPSQGTSWAFFAAAGKKYGLKVQEVGNDKKGQDEVLAALNTGKKLVIASTYKKPFTSKGHYIVLTSHKDGDVFVQDPNKKNQSKLFSFQDVVIPASKQYWIISKG